MTTPMGWLPLYVALKVGHPGGGGVYFIKEPLNGQLSNDTSKKQTKKAISFCLRQGDTVSPWRRQK